MYQYRTLRCHVDESEEKLTQLSYQGWRLVSITFEKYEHTALRSVSGGAGGVMNFVTEGRGGIQYHYLPTSTVQGIVAIFKRQVA